MMEHSSADRPALYRKALELSEQLVSYARDALPRLDSADEDELSACAERYTGDLDQLSDLWSQIRRSDASSEEQAECEPLRLAIRADLDALTDFDRACRSAVERRLREDSAALHDAQERKKLSIYGDAFTASQDGKFCDFRE